MERASEEELTSSRPAMASPGNPSGELPPSGSRRALPREEGELSSDGDQCQRECFDHSAPPSAGIAGPSLSAGMNLAPRTNGFMPVIQEAKAVRGNTPLSTIGISVQASLQQKREMSSATNQPTKNVVTRPVVPQGNNNLVISFSDDESSSSSDSNRQSRGFKSKGNIHAMHGIRKPSALGVKGPKKYGKVARNGNLNVAKRPSFSRTFVPSLMKNQGDTFVPSLKKYQGDSKRVDNVMSSGYLSRNSIANKRMEGQDLGNDYAIGSRNLELLDLRHQIALRESELKLRSAQFIRQPASSSRPGPVALNFSKDSVKRVKPADVAEVGPKGPPSKRLKVGLSSYAPQSVGRPEAASSSPPKVLALERSRFGGIDPVSSAGISEATFASWNRIDSEEVSGASRYLHEKKQDGVENGVTGQSEQAEKMANPALLPEQTLPIDTTDHNSINKSSEKSLTGGHWGSLSNVSSLKHGNKDLNSLVEFEESLDKALADAQDHRRTCEVEERNALKAYRKAQRALLEANARCAQFYQQRELYSSHLQSYIRDDPSLLGDSSKLDYVGVQTKSSNGVSENVEMVPTISQQMQTEDFRFNHQPMSGQNLDSEPCSEPEGSTSEPLPHGDNDIIAGESSPSNEQNVPAYENTEIFPCHGRQLKQAYQEGARETVERQTGNQGQSVTKASNDNSKESLLLEAKLRSQLFARLGARIQSSKGSDSNQGLAFEKESGCNFGNGKSDSNDQNGPLSDVERLQPANFDGNNKPGEGFDNTPVLDEDKVSLGQSASSDGQDISRTLKEGQNLACVVSLSTFSASAFHHLKVMTSLRFVSGQRNGQSDGSTTEDSLNYIGQNEQVNHISCSSSQDVMNINEEEASSYSDVAVDPFWPLCLFELRGRCNDEECPWQHARDYSIRKMDPNIHCESDGTDIQVALVLNGRPCTTITSHLMTQNPKYLVGLDILKADGTYNSVVARRVGQPWQKSFSMSLAVFGVFKEVLRADDSVLQNNDGRIEVFGRWNRQTSYFRNKPGGVNELKPSPEDAQSLETAILLFNQETDKLEGKRKALAVVSRALEYRPNSVVLWIAYLIFYYCKIKPAGKDDLYSIAVKHNQGSYELWLMYIHSRTKLNDRFAAYEEALLALFNHSSTSEGDILHNSSCILDLFLQMIDCFRMSGYTDKAVQIIYDLFPIEKKSNERFNSLLSNIISSCLTIFDKCIFWICCVYLVIYRKLPDAIVHQFECDKDVLSINWPPAHLTDEVKGHVTQLVECAVSNFESYISKEPNKHIKLAQGFALNHVRCKLALDGLESSRELLDRYTDMYLGCLDLALMSARVENYDYEGLSFHGFESALSNWPREADGFQCIWNQYAEYALDRGKADFAKELMERWFSSVWRLGSPEVDMDCHDVAGSCGNNSGMQASGSSSQTSASDSCQLDKIYGLLNLSLHKLLQNQPQAAREAVNQALSASDHKNYVHCLREHAVFMMTDPSPMKQRSYIHGILDLLDGYLTDYRASQDKEPLSRKFIEGISKTRVQQLMKDMLCPATTNFLLVNSVLESLFGPSLLPLKFGKEKDLVEFVEGVLEISPSNYQLAISVCKQIIGGGYEFEAPVTAASTSMSFWACSTVVSTLSHAVPIAPEYVWVEASTLLSSIPAFSVTSEGFYKKAFSVYPFSIRLWKSYYNSSRCTGKGHLVIEAAKEKGIDIDQAGR